MTTKKFLSLYTGKFSDYLFRKLHEYDEMYDLWKMLGITSRLQILDLTSAYANNEISLILVHRAILMEAIPLIGNHSVEKKLTAHINLVDKYLSKKYGDVGVQSNKIVYSPRASKLNAAEKRLYDMLILMPNSPRGWLERSISYCERVGVSSSIVENIFSLYIPNPYEKAKYASAS